ncbi:Fe-S cluster domain protein [Archaeoglobus veneficus SNP6]|uniref:Fe-S cluster domain protein n=2 Tax=Archaeoglobus veneficus TaxID=58290 RepID=F2KMK4_ARCVS|nr:Fe-S cluster domain protein [Archaeoglobus veneficus SNP6]
MQRRHSGCQRRWRRCSAWTFREVAYDSLTPVEVHEIDPKVAKILSLLPHRDCGACSYDTCYDLAVAIAERREKPDACRIVGKKVGSVIEKILRR